MKRWEVTFDGGVTGEDVEIVMSGTARVDAEGEDEATLAGFQKVSGLSTTFHDQHVEWEHTRTTEVHACPHGLTQDCEQCHTDNILRFPPEHEAIDDLGRDVEAGSGMICARCGKQHGA